MSERQAVVRSSLLQMKRGIVEAKEGIPVSLSIRAIRFKGIDCLILAFICRNQLY